MMKIAVLVSGGGTNLQAILESERRGENPNGKVTLVVASKPGVYALERAANFGVETAVVRRKDYATSEDHFYLLPCFFFPLLFFHSYFFQSSLFVCFTKFLSSQHPNNVRHFYIAALCYCLDS